MFKRKLNIVLALAVCAILLPMTVGGKDQVVRPMHLSGSGILVVTSIDWQTYTGTWEATESGEATHLGRYSLVESGTFYFTATGSVWLAEGTCTAADGDEFTFDLTTTCEGGHETGLMQITGGTGRFAGASGSVDLVSVTATTGAYTISGTGTIEY